MSWAPIERVTSFVRTRKIETETEMEESNIRKEVKLLVRQLVGEATPTIQLQNHPYWDGVRMSEEGDLYLLRARSSCKALIENADQCRLAIKIKLRSRKTIKSIDIGVDGKWMSVDLNDDKQMNEVKHQLLSFCRASKAAVAHR